MLLVMQLVQTVKRAHIHACGIILLMNVLLKYVKVKLEVFHTLLQYVYTLAVVCYCDIPLV